MSVILLASVPGLVDILHGIPSLSRSWVTTRPMQCWRVHIARDTRSIWDDRSMVLCFRGPLLQGSSASGVFRFRGLSLLLKEESDESRVRSNHQRHWTVKRCGDCSQKINLSWGDCTVSGSCFSQAADEFGFGFAGQPPEGIE